MLFNHQWGLVEITWEQFHRECTRYVSIPWIQNYSFKITAASDRDQWVNARAVSLKHINSNGITGEHCKNTYQLLNLKALKISTVYKNHIFQCMVKIFCVEFQREPFKFHTKNLTHTLNEVHFIQRLRFSRRALRFKSSSPGSDATHNINGLLGSVPCQDVMLLVQEFPMRRWDDLLTLWSPRWAFLRWFTNTCIEMGPMFSFCNRAVWGWLSEWGYGY